MKTKTKVGLATVTYHAVHTLRNLVGRKDVGIFRRNGSLYELDLSQGIDFSLFLLGAFEIGTTKALRRLVKPGFIAIDIGANIGAHTLGLARLVGSSGKVIACEPTRFAYEKLCKNISLNEDIRERITAIQCFLGPDEAIAVPDMIYSGWPLVGGVNLHPQHLGREESTSSCRHLSVDGIVAECKLSRVDLIKMDVDSFECDVLAGAASTVSNDKPTFVAEIAPYALKERGGSLSTFVNFFKNNGYLFFDERSEARLSMDLHDLEVKIGDASSINVIARHGA